jgi:transcriptional regulator with XRE-family HTH domain
VVDPKPTVTPPVVWVNHTISSEPEIRLKPTDAEGTSDPPVTVTMGTNDGGRGPRAVIHKRILDSAASEPDASLEALAAGVAGASPDLVERVLDEYGDPGDSEPAAPETTEEPAMPDQTPQTTADLDEKERATLETIAEHPEATQAELADVLGVSRATVNKRLNAIEGFEWADRQAFVASVLEDARGSRSPEAMSAPEAEAAVDGGHLLDPDAEQAVEQLQERLARLEQQVGGAVEASPIEDTELLAKVLRAVMADEEISEAEEVTVLEALR